MTAATWIGLVGFLAVAEFLSFVRRRSHAREVSATWLAEHQRISFYDR